VQKVSACEGRRLVAELLDFDLRLTLYYVRRPNLRNAGILDSKRPDYHLRFTSPDWPASARRLHHRTWLRGAFGRRRMFASFDNQTSPAHHRSRTDENRSSNGLQHKPLCSSLCRSSIVVSSAGACIRCAAHRYHDSLDDRAGYYASANRLDRRPVLLHFLLCIPRRRASMVQLVSAFIDFLVTP
jgi:hypothetical protein